MHLAAERPSQLRREINSGYSRRLGDNIVVAVGADEDLLETRSLTYVRIRN